MPHLPHALLPPCSLPAALAYLTLSFPDAVYPVFGLQHPSLAPCCPLGTRRSDSDSSKCARVSVQI